MSAPPLDPAHALEVAREVAARAGRLLREGWKARRLRVEHKGAVDLVTEYDRRSEALCVEAIKHAFPGHAVIGEEGSQVRGEELEGRPTWLIDPLDGTTNYTHHLPFYAVSIALELEGEPLCGVVHLPELGYEFIALRGGGAKLDGEPLRVSSVERLEESLCATGFSYDRGADQNNVPEFDAVLRRSQGVRRIGSAAFDCAMVAWGAIDGYWEQKLNAWDIAAGALLVLEAGGRVTTPSGDPYRSSAGALLASNGKIHEELRGVIGAARLAAGSPHRDPGSP
jgi:myo-inositol-1(or 4)-monophosphatase